MQGQQLRGLSTSPEVLSDSLSSQLHFIATDKYASTSLLGSLFSVPCTYYQMLFSITFLDLGAVKAQLAREKGNLRNHVPTPISFCADFQAGRWSDREHWGLPKDCKVTLGQEPNPSLSWWLPHLAALQHQISYVCFKFVLFTPIAKQTNPLLNFYFITKVPHLRNQIPSPTYRLLMRY